jgi:DsbC/DsbD-like thiol-disulfide interchange protein
MNKRWISPASWMIAAIGVLLILGGFAASSSASDASAFSERSPLASRSGDGEWGNAHQTSASTETFPRSETLDETARVRSDESPVRKVELVVLEPGESGPVRIGFHVELEPGWHLYWANPGDAGLAPSVRWDLPPGFTAGPLRHPVPEKVVEEGLVSYEHRGDVLLLCEIEAAPGHRAGARWEAAAVFEWMACRESCLTGEAPVKVVFPAGNESVAEGRTLLAKFAGRFPKPLAESGLKGGDGLAEWTGSAWRVEIPLAGPGAAGADDFFPLPLDGFVVDNAAVSCGDGKIVVSVVPSGGPGSPPPSAVGGIVLVDGAGYELSVPVAARHPDSVDRGINLSGKRSSRIIADSAAALRLHGFI